MKWTIERQDSGVLLIVTHNGQQWARLIRDSEYRDHYDRYFLFWMAVLNLKYAALGLWKNRRPKLDFMG